MANRKTDATRERNPGASIPSQEDEADILEEVGAVPDENGAFMADEESIRKIGAVDAESVRENRRRDDIVKKKRGNVANVPFNTGDVLDSYDTILRVFPTNQVEIRVKSLRTGATQTINSRPKSGAELYEALLLVHGQHEETEYEVSFVDSVRKGWLAKPRIVMPDMRPPAQQGQPPMQHQHPPQGYPPPGYPPPQYATLGFSPQQPVPQQPQPPPPAPVVQFTPPPAVDPMALMQQTFDLFQRMQASLQPPPQPYPYIQPPQQTVPAMPPPPQTNDPAVQAAWMKQAFDLFQQMQSALQRPAQQPQPQPQQPPQQTLAQAGPPGPPPRGMRWVWVHPYGFALEAEQPSQQERPANPMFRDRRPPYDPHGDRSAPYAPQQPPPQQQRPMTLAEQLRESVSATRATVEAMQEMSSLLPGYGGHQEPPAPETDDDDSPVRVIDWGPAKGVINRGDGSTRWGETLVANIPSALKWLGEQHEQIVERAERRQRQQAHQAPPPRQLRPGEVEVMPGQQPPPGYAFVPVEEESLPPPPAHVPPPISAPRRTWDAPTTPEEGER